jgi:hypothetical protein
MHPLEKYASRLLAPVGDALSRLTDDSAVKETSHRALNKRNVLSALAGASLGFGIRDAIEGTYHKGRPVLGLSYDPKKWLHRYGRYVAGAGGSLLGAALAYRLLAPKHPLEKTAFALPLIRGVAVGAKLLTKAPFARNIAAGAKALWKPGTASRQLISSAAGDAALQGGMGAVFSEKGQRLQGAASGAVFGGVFGGATGIGAHMGKLKEMGVDRFGQRLWGTVKQLGADTSNAWGHFKVGSQAAAAKVCFRASSCPATCVRTC